MASPLSTANPTPGALISNRPANSLSGMPISLTAQKQGIYHISFLGSIYFFISVPFFHSSLFSSQFIFLTASLFVFLVNLQ
jgi:hypothetical protein